MKYNTRFSAKRIEATDLDPEAMALQFQTPKNQNLSLFCDRKVGMYIYKPRLILEIVLLEYCWERLSSNVVVLCSHH